MTAMNKTEMQQTLIAEVKNRGYDYIEAGEPFGANYHEMHIIICDRDAPTEFTNEGEYLVCVSYAYEPESYGVFDGEGFGGHDYDVTNEQGYYDGIDEAFDRVDELFQENER